MQRHCLRSLGDNDIVSSLQHEEICGSDIHSFTDMRLAQIVDLSPKNSWNIWKMITETDITCLITWEKTIISKYIWIWSRVGCDRVIRKRTTGPQHLATLPSPIPPLRSISYRRPTVSPWWRPPAPPPPPSPDIGHWGGTDGDWDRRRGGGG